MQSKPPERGGVKWCMHHFKSERGKFVVVHPPILPVRAAKKLAAALSRCMHQYKPPLVVKLFNYLAN